MIRKDTLWKAIIEDLAEEFVRFFFADYLEQIDLARGFVFLDKELKQLAARSASQVRHADKLFKAWLVDGQEQWFLIHVEVQGYADRHFARRMYEYAYRIQDRHQRPVTALVIYTCTDRRFHFTTYQSSFFGTEIIYRFRTFVLINYSPEELRRAGGLFGWVMEVARRELQLRDADDLNRFQVKLGLVRYLFQQGVDRRKIRHLLDFIGTYLPFEQSQFLHKFEEEIQQITKSRKTMSIREAIINDAKEQGFEQGIEQKERTVVTRAWQKGLPAAEIAELADMPLDRVEAIIRELEQESNADH